MEAEWNRTDLELAGALRRLLKSRFVLRTTNEKWFKIIIERRSDIESLLQKLAARLEIQESLGVAHVKPLSDEVEEMLGYQLGRRKTLSPLASALLFHLRYLRLQFFLNPSEDSAPTATLVELREFLQNLSSLRIDSQFERAFRRALEEMVELQVLMETRLDSNLFEITGLCDILLPVSQIDEVKERLQKYFAAMDSGVAGRSTKLGSPEGQDVG